MTEKKYIIRMEREGKTIQGSPAYCAGKIGVRYSTILDAVEDLQYGIVRRINGWRILYRINNGGIPVEFVPVNETVGSATATPCGCGCRHGHGGGKPIHSAYQQEGAQLPDVCIVLSA